MKILVVNPNSTESMTRKIVEAAEAAASPGVAIMGATAAGAPASIEGHFDEAMSLPGLLAQVAAGEEQGIGGIVVACFDDPGIGACRELASGRGLSALILLPGPNRRTIRGTTSGSSMHGSVLSCFYSRGLNADNRCYVK